MRRNLVERAGRDSVSDASHGPPHCDPGQPLRWLEQADGNNVGKIGIFVLRLRGVGDKPPVAPPLPATTATVRSSTAGVPVSMMTPMSSLVYALVAVSGALPSKSWECRVSRDSTEVRADVCSPRSRLKRATNSRCCLRVHTNKKLTRRRSGILTAHTYIRVR